MISTSKQHAEHPFACLNTQHWAEINQALFSQFFVQTDILMEKFNLKNFNLHDSHHMGRKQTPITEKQNSTKL